MLKREKGPLMAIRSECLARLYLWQVSRKCSTVSGMQHLVQRGESTALIRERKPFRAAWPVRSCVMMLPACLDLPLYRFSAGLDGGVGSMRCRRLPCLLSSHSLCHSALALFFCPAFSADVLLGRSFDNVGLRCVRLVVLPSAAALASMSTRLLPSIPSWPGTQQI